MSDIGKDELVNGGELEETLAREEWDFSTLEPQEFMPALLWEMIRESEQARKDVALVKLKAGSDAGGDFTERDAAMVRIEMIFQEFLEVPDTSRISTVTGTTGAKNPTAISSPPSAVVRCFPNPWLCLHEEDRKRLALVYHRNRAERVVSIGTWSDVASRFEQEKPNPALPLKFDSSATTTMLLTIDWRHSRRRILSTMADILKQLEPMNVKPVDERGRKDRDIQVALERLAIMRLLHHYSFSEIKRVLPDAWALYEKKKWYDDRRRALTDFRSMVRVPEAEKQFPRSWNTKGRGRVFSMDEH